MNSKIKVSGNIISELSEKIPSNIIALNELLKNAYDAGAPKATIILDTSGKMLQIIDTGSGMDKADIDTLFHISKSTKKYGQLNEYDRYTQGAKGLGFLSVFRFGRFVEWKTRKENEIGYVFKADYNSLVTSDDISQFEIEVIKDDTLEKGTTITITLDDYNAKSLESFFAQGSNYKKILNSFDDEKFTVELHINETTNSSNNTPSVKDNVPEHQLYYVTYNSKEQIIKFHFNDHVAFKEEYPFDSSDYSLDIELVIFHLPPHGKEKVDKLFINPHNTELTPLIYVNSNLFNNYDLFDPSIMKNIKTTSVLNQMIGLIRITSENENISFNSDRSQFLQNELTDSIKRFLADLNKCIQTLGSQKKNYLVKWDFLTVSELPPECQSVADCEDFRNYIKSDFAFISDVAIERNGNKVTYSLFGKEKVLDIKDKTPSQNGNGGQNGNPPAPAVINLNVNTVKLAVPTEQIDLKQYIASIYDSTRTLVPNDLVTITIDGVQVNGGILASVTEPDDKDIIFSYQDSRTGLAMKKLKISFFLQASKVTGNLKEDPLISIPAKEKYQISYNPSVSNLITQINSLELKDYSEVIACSLRAGFEISTDSLDKSSKFGNLFTNISGVEDRVIKVIDYINNNTSFISAISLSSKMEFKSLQKLLDVERFRSGISTAHLGAHKAGTYVSEAEIKQLAKLLGLFVVVANEMLQNNSIT